MSTPSIVDILTEKVGEALLHRADKQWRDFFYEDVLCVDQESLIENTLDRWIGEYPDPLQELLTSLVTKALQPNGFWEEIKTVVRDRAKESGQFQEDCFKYGYGNAMLRYYGLSQSDFI